MPMTVSQAQTDMRQGYYSGGPGIFASALAWTAAAGTAAMGWPGQAVWVLLIGGALIVPVGFLICRLFGARGAHTKGNPLGSLAGASTFWLIFLLPLAYVLGIYNSGWFFAAMLLIIGGRYLVFATLYGMRLYWILGLSLAAAGFLSGALDATATLGASAGAALELVFAVACLMEHRNWAQLEHSTEPAPRAGA